MTCLSGAGLIPDIAVKGAANERQGSAENGEQHEIPTTRRSQEPACGVAGRYVGKRFGESRNHSLRGKRHTVTVWDWIETVPGTLKWQDVGTDGTTTKGELTLYADPQAEAPGAVLADDGTYYVVQEALGQDSLRAAYRLEVSRWAGTAPRIRSAAP
jgi:hypothetical protein